MRILLLGYSNIARRRVLPALSGIGVDAIDIASVSASAVECDGKSWGRLFRSYDEALCQTDAQVVYISTVNSLHTHWAERALAAGLHVIVDKPACLTLQDTRKLIALAAQKQRCIAEATVYSYHPQIERALQVFREAGSAPTRIVATFSFPPLAVDNFRYRSQLGGGALWDLGAYAVTPGRVVFADAPTEIIARCNSAAGELETSFSMIALYRQGRTSVGAFGFTTGYINRLDIMGPDLVVTVERAFSPPADAGTTLVVRCRDQKSEIQVPAADSFELFLRKFLTTVIDGDYASFSKVMLADAEALNRLRADALQSRLP